MPTTTATKQEVREGQSRLPIETGDSRRNSNNESGGLIESSNQYSSTAPHVKCEQLYFTKAVAQHEKETIQYETFPDEKCTTSEHIQDNTNSRRLETSTTFSELFVNNVLNSLKAEIDEKRETTTTTTTTAISQDDDFKSVEPHDQDKDETELACLEEYSDEDSFPVPDCSQVASELGSWLQNTTKHGFLHATQADYEAEISYEADGIVQEEGVPRIFDPYYALELDEIERIEGRVDGDGYPKDKALVTTRSGDDVFGVWRHGVRCGCGRTLGTSMETFGIRTIQGNYVDGILHGLGKATLTSGLSFTGIFNSGYLEGPVVGLPVKDVFNSSNQSTIEQESSHLTEQIAMYRAGLPSGHMWQGLQGGGWLHGQVNDKGELTGDDIMFVYPDLTTCLVGKFQKGVMVSARLSYIQTLDWDREIRVAVPYTGSINNNAYSRSLSSHTGFTVHKMVWEPYERARCIVGSSSIQGAGEGLFARRDIQAGEIVSFYHGIWYPYGAPCRNPNYDYQIFLDWDRAPKSAYLDIPPEFTSVEAYRASLGHKVNHGFSPNCEFLKFHHPIFSSQVLAVRAITDISQGEEYTVNYKYDLYDAPEWYQNIFRDEL